MISDELKVQLKEYADKTDALREEIFALTTPVWNILDPILTQCVEHDDLGTLVMLDEIVQTGYISFEINRRIRMLQTRMDDNLKAKEDEFDAFIRGRDESL